MYFRRLTKCATLGNNLIHTSVRRNAFVKDVYKVLQYEAPFNEVEKQKILKVLNSPNENDINSYCTLITSKYIKSHRENNGDFNKVENLLDVQKFGLHSLEKLCNNILTEDSVEKKVSSSKRWNGMEIAKAKTFFADFKPRPKLSLYGDGEKTIIGLKVAVHSVTYSKIDKQQNLLSWGIIPAIQNSKSQVNFVHDKLFKTTREVLKEIPVGDYYILEDMIPIMPKDPQFSIKYKLNLASFRTSLLTQILLRNAVQPEVHSMKPSVLEKIFDLKIGMDRKSMNEHLKQIIEPKIFEENPFVTNISEKLWDEYKEKLNKTGDGLDEEDTAQYTSNVDKEALANSLLLSLAFNSLVVAAEKGLFKA